MNILGRIINVSMTLALAFLPIGALLHQAAYAVTINFHSVEATCGPIDAANYLDGVGITSANVLKEFPFNPFLIAGAMAAA